MAEHDEVVIELPTAKGFFQAASLEQDPSVWLAAYLDRLELNRTPDAASPTSVTASFRSSEPSGSRAFEIMRARDVAAQMEVHYSKGESAPENAGDGSRERVGFRLRGAAMNKRLRARAGFAVDRTRDADGLDPPTGTFELAYDVLSKRGSFASRPVAVTATARHRQNALSLGDSSLAGIRHHLTNEILVNSELGPLGVRLAQAWRSERNVGSAGSDAASKGSESVARLSTPVPVLSSLLSGTFELPVNARLHYQVVEHRDDNGASTNTRAAEEAGFELAGTSWRTAYRFTNDFRENGIGPTATTVGENTGHEVSGELRLRPGLGLNLRLREAVDDRIAGRKLRSSQAIGIDARLGGAAHLRFGCDRELRTETQTGHSELWHAVRSAVSWPIADPTDRLTGRFSAGQSFSFTSSGSAGVADSERSLSWSAGVELELAFR